MDAFHDMALGLLDEIEVQTQTLTRTAERIRTLLHMSDSGQPELPMASAAGLPGQQELPDLSGTAAGPDPHA